MRALIGIAALVAACSSKPSGHPSCPEGTRATILEHNDVFAVCSQPDAVVRGLELHYEGSNGVNRLSAACTPVARKSNQAIDMVEDRMIFDKQADGVDGYWRLESGALADLAAQIAGKQCAGKPVEPLWSEFAAVLPIEIRGAK